MFTTCIINVWKKNMIWNCSCYIYSKDIFSDIDASYQLCVVLTPIFRFVPLGEHLVFPLRYSYSCYHHFRIPQIPSFFFLEKFVVFLWTSAGLSVPPCWGTLAGAFPIFGRWVPKIRCGKMGWKSVCMKSPFEGWKRILFWNWCHVQFICFIWEEDDPII